MTQKKNKEFEKWALPKLIKYQKILLLEDFHPLKIEFSDSDASECVFVYPYKSITVRYSKGLLEAFKKKDYDHILDVLVHELCHAITDPLYAKATSRWCGKEEVEDEREGLTDHIANIIRKLDK